MRISRNLAEKLPKTDLHCHLDGSIRPETLIELAQKNGVALPSYEKESMMAAMGYGRPRKTLEHYLAGFEPLLAVMQDSYAIERVFYEVCEDAHLENVWHLELRYCPYLHTKKGLSSEDVVKAAIRGAKRAQKDFSISIVHILCGLKNDPHASILEVAKLAAAYRNLGVVAFDLAGPEAGFPLIDHLEAIFYAKKRHLFITLHAGENFGPESISQAIHQAGAQRIGHGTSLIKDPELLAYVVDHRIGVEACPISNWHTGAVRSLDEHPIKKFLEEGVRVSINTDNRLCSDTTVTEEIMAVVESLDLSLEQVRRLLENGFKSAFLPYKIRSLMLEDFNKAWLKLLSCGL